MTTTIYDVVNALRKAIFPEKKRYIQTTIIPFATQTATILNKKFKPPIFLYSIEATGNIKTDDETNIIINQKEPTKLYGISSFQYSGECSSLKIIPKFGAERYGKIIVSYEGVYFLPSPIGTSGMPQNLIDYIGTIDRIEWIEWIQRIYQIVSIQTVEAIKSVERAYIGNLPYLINADFESWSTATDCLAWLGTYTRIETVFTGQYAMWFDDIFDSCKQNLELPIECKYIEKLSCVAYGNNAGFNDSKLRFTVYYTDGTNDYHEWTIPIWTWTYCDMTPYIDTTKMLIAIKLEGKTYFPMYVDTVILLSSERRTITGIMGLEGRRYYESSDVIIDEKVVCDIPSKNITLQKCTFSCDHATRCYLTVYPYKKDGTIDNAIKILQADGYTVTDLSPSNLNSFKSEIWEELVYSAGTSEFKFGLKKNLVFANGVKITMTNLTSDQLMQCEVLVNIEGE